MRWWLLLLPVLLSTSRSAFAAEPLPAPLFPWALGTPYSAIATPDDTYEKLFSDPEHGQYVLQTFRADDPPALRNVDGQWMLYFFDDALAYYERQVRNIDADGYQRRRNALEHALRGAGWTALRGPGRNYTLTLISGELEVQVRYWPAFDYASCISDDYKTMMLVQYGPRRAPSTTSGPVDPLADFRDGPNALIDFIGWAYTTDSNLESYYGECEVYTWAGHLVTDVDKFGYPVHGGAPLTLLGRAYPPAIWYAVFSPRRVGFSELAFEPGSGEGDDFSGLPKYTDVLRALHGRGWRLTVIDPQDAKLERDGAWLRASFWFTDCICGMGGSIEIAADPP